MEELYRYSKERENIEYCKNIKEYLNQHSELYPDADVLADFFDNGSNLVQCLVESELPFFCAFILWGEC